MQKTLHPVLVEQGFEVDKRRAVRVDGPVAVVFEALSLSKRMAHLLQLAAASFSATLGSTISAQRHRGSCRSWRHGRPTSVLTEHMFVPGVMDDLVQFGRNT